MAIHESITCSRQEKFQIERDLLSEKLDFEDSDSSVETAYKLCKKTALIGEFMISDTVKQEILQDAARSFLRICADQKEYLSPADGWILTVACVLLSQSSITDPEEQKQQDTAQTWLSIQEGLHFDEISQKTGCNWQTAQIRLREILKDPRNIRFFAENGQRFYNTLRLHSLSPVWSIKNLYDILYSFYHKNLECSYDPDSNVASLFTAGIRRRWEDDSPVTDQKLRADQLASSLRELFVLRPNYMAAVCDALLERIDRIVQGDFTLLDSKNRWDTLLLDWYQSKTEYERGQMRSARKAAVRRKVVDRQENIHPEFTFENGGIFLSIPGIRHPEIREQPWVRLYQNNTLVYEHSLFRYGNEVLWSTKLHKIPLHQLKTINWNQPLHFSVSIDSGPSQIYRSGSELYRDYLCFTPGGNETRLIRCSQMLQLVVRRSADLLIDDPEDNWTVSAAPYQLISLWPESVRSIKLNGKELLTDQSGRPQKIWAYMTPEAVSGILAKADDTPVSVYAQPPVLHVVLPNRSDAKNYQLTIDGQTQPLYAASWNDEKYQIPLPTRTGSHHVIQLKDFESGTIIFRRVYTLVPGLACSFDRPYYPDRDCSGTLSVRSAAEDRTYPFDLTPGEDTVAWQMADMWFETTAPRLRAEINGMNAFYLPETIWHEDMKYAFLSVRAPREVQISVMFGGKLLTANSIGNYEIGTEMEARKQSATDAILGLLIRSKDACEQLKLTDIRFAETFLEDPVVLEGRRLLWRPREDAYIGAKDSPVFLLELENSIQEEPFTYRLTLKPEVMANHFPGREGTYGYVLWLTNRRKRFSRLPDLKLLEGSITVTDPPENRFRNKYIDLTRVHYYDHLAGREASAPMQRDSAQIDEIEFHRMVEPDGQPLPEFRGTLGFWTKSGYQEFSDRETKRYEKVNPVFFTLTPDGYITVYTENEETLTLNLKPLRQDPRGGAARIYSRKDELLPEELKRYQGISDYFEYEEYEDN